MNFHQKLQKNFQSKSTLLCVGLDPELEKLPSFLEKKPESIIIFCKEIIDSTAEFCIGFKPNIAFFERFGSIGLKQWELVIEHIKKNYPDHIIVADAKRGDLANTSKEYAHYFFKSLEVDSLTVSPYMGKDSLIPYLETGKQIFLLCLTSNPSSSDFQRIISSSDSKTLYELVATLSLNLHSEFKDQVGLVVGATHPKELGSLRKEFPELPFLIPGYGAQGGNLQETLINSGTNSLINSSRSILYASSEKDFAIQARSQAKTISEEMKAILQKLS
ncbi:MAG: orotidine-5'-phosphate decarboxylase [Leptospiraceae bacterium]|nr:orotidine-5'-phosphate decarboxylase [Leptospiraceae bacterium]